MDIFRIPLLVSSAVFAEAQTASMNIQGPDNAGTRALVALGAGAVFLRRRKALA